MSELAAQLGGRATTGPDPVVVTAAASTVLGPVDVQAFDRFTVYVTNVGGGLGNDLTALTVESSPVDDVPDLWVFADDVLAGNLASGEVTLKSLARTSMKYVRLRANCAGGENTTIKVWLSVGGHP